MKRHFLSALPLALIAPFATAQDEAMPGPGPEHKELQRFVGTWQVHVVNHMNPGAEPETMDGIDETTSVCNGMWVMTRIAGEGLPFTGLAFTGYDTMKSKYVGVWVDSMGPQSALSEGSFDKKASAFTMVGDMVTPMGPAKTRSLIEWQGADARTEKMWNVGKDGQETLWMEITAKRLAKGAKPAPAAANKGTDAVAMPDPKDPMHKTLAAWVGTWTADCTMSMPGAPEMKGEMTQTESLVCGDLWVHTVAKGTFAGMPFEGHGLTGYDPQKKLFVGFWLDGFSPVLAQSTGTCDKDGKVLTMKGHSFDQSGTKTNNSEVTTWKDKDHRTLTMKSTYDDGKDAGVMTIEYARSGK